MFSLHSLFFKTLQCKAVLSLETAFSLHKKSKYNDHFKEAAHRVSAFEIKQILFTVKRSKILGWIGKMLSSHLSV